MKWLSIFCCGLMLTMLSPVLLAIDSEPPFQDPTMQVRYERLIHEFRCLVCQDETIADSNADLAADFRRQVHDQVAAGKTDADIRTYMVNRYGDFILYKPPVQVSTWFLWFGPFLFLAIAVGTVVVVIRHRNSILRDSTENDGETP